MRGWRAARFAELEEDAPAQVERRLNARRYRAYRRRRIIADHRPTDSERAIGRALATERASVLDRDAFHRYLAGVRVGGPFALSCSATGFIYWKLGEIGRQIPVADFLTRAEMEERKSFLLGDSALPVAEDRSIAEGLADLDALLEDDPLVESPDATEPADTAGEMREMELAGVAPSPAPHVVAVGAADSGQQRA